MGRPCFTGRRDHRHPRVVQIIAFGASTFSCDDGAHRTASSITASRSDHRLVASDSTLLVPVFDFTSCYPDDALAENGGANPGLPPNGSYRPCRDPLRLAKAKLYVRSARAEADGARYTATLFALYFPKDEATLSAFSHRHDWESVVFYRRDEIPTHMGFSQHGQLSIRPWRSLAIDDLGRPHVRVGSLAIETSAMHPARVPHREGITPDLIEWPFPPCVAQVLEETDWGKAVCPVADRNFLGFLEKAMPQGYPPDLRWQSEVPSGPPSERP